ncbi:MULTISPECIES: hypothetical protein [unclassified Dyella]|jgi:hypothetical protein|uniref:hypothetical protein n=1 Tax=unclassified Dyella TaxID=2634549 RepID=UPI003F8F3FAC
MARQLLLKALALMFTGACLYCGLTATDFHALTVGAADESTSWPKVILAVAFGIAAVTALYLSAPAKEKASER